ncbi:MurR/RpiR family transcriptional regulator [Streptomyces sp. NPDC001508]|uniref:MurR/RpiR family transcriptional regulator n=1 Tax=Streptomyces sp. NPDC001508 TaxID=3154656 RepID=UPI00332AB651
MLGRIRAERSSLPEALQRVAEQILADPAGAALATIVDLAERSSTSTATVTRFCRAFDFGGYAGLRVALATETGRADQARWDLDIGREILPADPLDRVLGIVASAAGRAVQETAAQLDLDALDRLTGALAQARRVEVLGIGSSATAASELVFRLQRIGVVCWARCDVHSALTNASLLAPGDVAIGLSHSGRTHEVVEVITEAASHGATTAAVTSFSQSPLAEAADIVLTSAPHETTFRPEALAALHSQLLVLDLLYVALAQRTYEQSSERFAVTARAVSGHRLPTTPPAGGRRQGGRRGTGPGLRDEAPPTTDTTTED